VFLLITQTDSTKFFLISRLSHEFLGGLAAIFSRLSLSLAAIFAAAAAMQNFCGQSNGSGELVWQTATSCLLTHP